MIFRLSLEKVTIFGESAGGWSVSLHLTSHQSKGHFSSAIVQSGGIEHSCFTIDKVKGK